MKYTFFFFLFFGFFLGVHAQYNGIASGSVDFTFVEKEVEGSVSGFVSTSKIDWNDLENSIMEGYVLSETLKTGNFIRDWSLKGEKYFDTDTFPRISFKSTTIEEKGDGILVNGILTLKGISKQIEIQFDKKGKNLQGTTTLFTTDFDITIFKKSREANKVELQFQLTLE